MQSFTALSREGLAAAKANFRSEGLVKYPIELNGTDLDTILDALHHYCVTGQDRADDVDENGYGLLSSILETLDVEYI